jgi:hypothetical protein
LLLAAVSQASIAQVPELGRYQDFAYSADAVQSQTQIFYDDQLADLRRKHQLDDSPDFDARVQRIAAGLIEQAIKEKPVAASWHWEVHTTSDPDQAGSCWAGGKLLFGTVYTSGIHRD